MNYSYRWSLWISDGKININLLVREKTVSHHLQSKLIAVYSLCHANNYFNIAVLFFSLDELVRDGENGNTFEDAEQLGQQIKSWFEGFPNNEEQNQKTQKYKENIQTFFHQKWESNWDLRAKAIFT